MSRLTEFAVSKRSVTILLAVALFIAGISAWGSLKQELLPDIEFPVITIVAPYPGAGAEDVADQVAEPIERAVSGVPRLESLQSTSANSVSLVVALFSFGTDVDAVEAEINENLRSVGLPATVEPQVAALNINAAPVIISSIAATSEDGLDEVAELTRSEIVPSIAAIEGVASADVTGGLENQLLVTLDPAAMTAAGVSVQQIQGVLQANNLTLPSGQLTDGVEQIPVSTTASIATAASVMEACRTPSASESGPATSAPSEMNAGFSMRSAEMRPRIASGAEICSIAMLLEACAISAAPPTMLKAIAMANDGLDATPMMAAPITMTQTVWIRPWRSARASALAMKPPSVPPTPTAVSSRPRPVGPAANSSFARIG